MFWSDNDDNYDDDDIDDDDDDDDTDDDDQSASVRGSNQTTNGFFSSQPQALNHSYQTAYCVYNVLYIAVCALNHPWAILFFEGFKQYVHDVEQISWDVHDIQYFLRAWKCR